MAKVAKGVELYRPSSFFLLGGGGRIKKHVVDLVFVCFLFGCSPLKWSSNSLFMFVLKEFS